MEKQKISQTGKPTGVFGRLYARGMAWGHRDFYKNASTALNLKNEDVFLEIGFGSGLFIKKYASHVSRIAGIDYSADMVRLASDINKKLVDSGKTEFKLGEPSSLPWADNEFSAAAAIETFYFWPEPQLSLKEICRVLRPGGRLVIDMAFNKDDGRDHSRDIKKMNMEIYSNEEVQAMLKEAGFGDMTVAYYKGAWAPFAGYIVPRGMIVKAIKK